MNKVIGRKLLKSDHKYIWSQLLKKKYSQKITNMQTDDFEEIKINVPWGHISGKWWGPKNVRPILGLHGWQDNAGTFDRLAPLLPNHISLLAIDLPGHGFSSRIPNGMSYNNIDTVLLIKMISKEYNWDKISIMAHSMGSILGFLYTGIYPNEVDMMIGIDALKPHIRPVDTIGPDLKDGFDKYMIADERNQLKSEPPSYEYEQLIDRLCEGTSGSVTKEVSPYLLERAIQKSEKYPEKYFFTRDSRIKYNIPTYVGQDVCLTLAKRITCPYLFLKAKDAPVWEKKQYHKEALEVMCENPYFEHHEINAKHHLHLTNPELVAPIICEFINKYRPLELASKL